MDSPTTPPPSAEDSLLPCPFCGDKPRSTTFIKSLLVWCGRCGMTPISNHRWNLRALDASDRRDAFDAAYYAGWKKAASWANRDDLIYDEGSMAYQADLDAAYARAKEGKL